MIVLLTDFGQNEYVGVMKAVIYRIDGEAKVVDLCHDISAQSVIEASWVLKNNYKYFPEGAVFCCVVDPGVGSIRKPIVLEADEKFFVGPDNGVFACVMLEAESYRAYEISNPKYFLSAVSFTFHGRDIFAPAAAHLSLGVPIEDLGKRLLKPFILEIQEPDIREEEIIGEVIYEDTFGNLITNIPGSMVDSNCRLYVCDILINGVCKSYSEAPEGELLAVIGSSGFIELSVNRGRASDLIKCGSRKVYIRKS